MRRAHDWLDGGRNPWGGEAAVPARSRLAEARAFTAQECWRQLDRASRSAVGVALVASLVFISWVVSSRSSVAALTREHSVEAAGAAGAAEFFGAAEPAPVRLEGGLRLVGLDDGVWTWTLVSALDTNKVERRGQIEADGSFDVGVAAEGKRKLLLRRRWDGSLSQLLILPIDLCAGDNRLTIEFEPWLLEGRVENYHGEDVIYCWTPVNDAGQRDLEVRTRFRPNDDGSFSGIRVPGPGGRFSGLEPASESGGPAKVEVEVRAEVKPPLGQRVTRRTGG